VRRCVLLLVLLTLLVTVPPVEAMTLSEGWTHVQEALENGNPQVLRDSGEEFLTLAHDLGIRRLTPYSSALLCWSEAQSGPLGQTAAKLAGRFDPWSPGVSFHEARSAWADGSYFHSIGAYLRGWRLLVADWNSRRQLTITVVPWLLLALLGALAVGIVMNTIRFLPELFHDGWELGRLLFSRTNAVVFAAVVVSLPIFAGLGPVWLLGWLFALSWTYLEPRGRIVAGVVWLLALALVPLNEVWLHTMLRPAGAPAKAVAMILERRADPSVLQELSDLGKTLDGSESYHLVMGALFRLHGDDLSARAHFQRAALTDKNDPRPLIFLGNVALEDGNPSGAIQYYRRALERDGGNAMAYYNLSRAYDQTYRFEEADQMRRKAEKLAGKKGVGRNAEDSQTRVLDPYIGWPDLERMREEVGAQTWSTTGLGTPRLGVRELFLHPVPLAVLFTGVLGLLMAWARSRWMWKSTACARCGKVFCPRCKTATESDAYCSQCISVFLKRDAVAIEQQAVKVEQVRRREAWENLGRRVASIVLPGSGEILLGRWALGTLRAFLVVLFVLGAILWLPAFVAPMEPQLMALPLQVALILLALAFWVHSVVVSWKRR